jgi:hypothetical protein
MSEQNHSIIAFNQPLSFDEIPMSTETIGVPAATQVEPTGNIFRVRGEDSRIYVYDESGWLICGATSRGTVSKKNVDDVLARINEDYAGVEDAQAIMESDLRTLNDYICSAPSVCRHLPVAGRARCRFHGGNAEIGLANVKTRTGKYSKNIGSRLIAAYQEGMRDKEHLDLKDNVAVVDALIQETLANMGGVPSAKLWKDAKGLYDKLVRAIRASDQEIIALALNELGTLIRQGNGDAEAKKELKGYFESKRRLVETDARIKRDKNRYVDAEEYLNSVKSLYEVISSVLLEQLPTEQAKKVMSLIGKKIAKQLEDKKR